jgi:hypothetical protein
MATLPCDAHGGIARGRLCTAYPALLQDGNRKSAKRRLCMDCMHDLLVMHATDWQDQVLKLEQDAGTTCTRCGEVYVGNGQLSRFFCTAYIDGKTRRDYFALYCDSCAQFVAEELSLA